MKKQNGMGHITLILSIIVMIILVAVVINVLQLANTNRKIENLTTDMLLVQGKIKIIAQENEMNNEKGLLGKKVQDNMEDEKIKKLIEEKVISAEDENFDKYYIIDSENLKELNLENTLNGEYYIVNYADYEVIYSRGIEIDEKVHYTLSELLEHRDNEEHEKVKENTNEEINKETVEQVNEEV